MNCWLLKLDSPKAMGKMQTSMTSSNILIELPFPCENHQHNLIILGHYSALLSSHHNSMQLCLQHSESFLENFLHLSKVLLQSISKFLCTTLSGPVTEMTSLIDNNYSFKFFSFFFFVTVKNTLIKLFKRRKEFTLANDFRDFSQWSAVSKAFDIQQGRNIRV